MTIYQLPFNQLTLFIIYFSVPSVAKNCVYPCKSVSNFPSCLLCLFVANQICVHPCSFVVNFPSCLRVFVAETQLAAAKPFGEDGSIKNNKLCETNPIFQKVKCL